MSPTLIYFCVLVFLMLNCAVKTSEMLKPSKFCLSTDHQPMDIITPCKCGTAPPLFIVCQLDTFTVAPKSATELAVSWTAESCTPNTEYMVEYRLINQDQCMELGNGQKEYVTASGKSSALTGLLPFSTYEVSVITATELATTQGSRPTGFPQNIRALSTTYSSITYSWTKPMCGERNGIIDKYIYTFLKTGSSPDLLHNNVLTSDTTVAFNDLEPYTEYSFIISANTEDGIGPATTFKHRTRGGVVSPRSSTGLIAGVAIAVILFIIIIIIVIAITVVYRRRKASMKETPKETTIDENEIYDEIDAKKEMMAKQQQQQQQQHQRSQTVETGYEVNIALETKTSTRAPSDGSDYEDVNIKEETEYQGLDLDAVGQEQSYQDLKGNTAGDKNAPMMFTSTPDTTPSECPDSTNSGLALAIMSSTTDETRIRQNQNGENTADDTDTLRSDVALPTENPDEIYADVNPATLNLGYSTYLSPGIDNATDTNTPRGNVPSPTKKPELTYAYADVDPTTFNIIGYSTYLRPDDDNATNETNTLRVNVPSPTENPDLTNASDVDPTSMNMTRDTEDGTSLPRSKVPMPPPVELDVGSGDLAKGYYVNIK